ncbi:hypothetical protein F2Q70_00002723 [Brassica cretica]|uniref:Uncharacterized protein n=1 Tax=Brassica cretica TaxID=69181 RepID=A0A8S9IM41_BRACR|nr:hypothetical protein F2Q70_00002723 [Brassica cretica]
MCVKESMRCCSIGNLYMQVDMWSTRWIGQARGVAMHATRPCGQTCGGRGVSLHGARPCIQTGRGRGVTMHVSRSCNHPCGARAHDPLSFEHIQNTSKPVQNVREKEKKEISSFDSFLAILAVFENSYSANFESAPGEGEPLALDCLGWDSEGLYLLVGDCNSQSNARLLTPHSLLFQLDCPLTRLVALPNLEVEYSIELDSGQLPSGRMRNPNRNRGPLCMLPISRGNPRFPTSLQVLCIKSKEEPPGSLIASGFQSKISGSKEEPPGSYVAKGFQKIKKKLETLCSQGRIHYNFKNLRVPVKRSPDLNLRVPIRPQSYNLKNLWVPTKIFGSIIESLDSYIASGLNSRSQDPPKRHPDVQNDFRRTSGLLRDSRILMQPPGYKINLQTPIVHILARNLLVYSLSFNLRKERDHRLHSPTSIEKQAERYPLKEETCKTLLLGACEATANSK